eukprot:1129406-Rhodomonas_salina.1
MVSGGAVSFSCPLSVFPSFLFFLHELVSDRVALGSQDGGESGADLVTHLADLTTAAADLDWEVMR